MLNVGKSWCCELRLRSWYQSCPNNVNGKTWALVWQQVTLGWLHAVLQFENCGCRCHCWWNGLTGTDLLISEEKVLCQWLLSWSNIRWPSHTKRRRSVIPMQINDLEWNSFVLWLKTLGSLKIFSSLISALWWVCRTHFFGRSSHAKPWGNGDEEEIFQKGSASHLRASFRAHCVKKGCLPALG